MGGLPLSKGGMQVQVLGTGLTQMPAPQPPAAVQTHVRKHICGIDASATYVTASL